MDAPHWAALGPIHPKLLAAIAERGWGEPTEIQSLAVPVVLGGGDALLVSPTGTGKTEAALIPLLSERLLDPTPAVAVLYVTPLRALNRDLEQRLVGLAESVGLTAAVRHGDTPTAARTRQVRRPPDLLLTTPETLQLLLTGARLREGMRSVRAVVVDELHELAGNDRGAQLTLTLERLDAFVGRPVRRIGLSATIANPSAVARFLSPAPREVEVREARRPRQVVIRTKVPRSDFPPLEGELVEELKSDPEGIAALRTIVEEVRAHRTTLVFVNTRPTAEAIAARLHRLAPELPIAVHHGSLSREVREEAERQFRSGELRAIVATSSLELGIDVGAVDLVVHFGSPHQAGRLLQRIGRSGHRVDREVKGTVLALDDEDLEEAAVLARRAAQGEIEPVRWRHTNRLAAGQQIVAALRANGAQSAPALLSVLRRSAAVDRLDEADWEALLGYLKGLGSLGLDGERIRPGRATLDRFYATLSLIPDERTFKLRDIATRRPIGVLDERFVVTQILADPQQIFLLHGRTWKVVEFREGELLVEGVREIGREPRWAGEDLPVPFDVAQEIGRLRRDRAFDLYPLEPAARLRLDARYRGSDGPVADDRTITITARDRLAIFGAAFGNRTNRTLALAASGLLAARLGARVEIAAIEPTWFVLSLPVALDGGSLAQALSIGPETLEPLLERLLPAELEYRWTFLTVARKLGVLPASSDPRELKLIEPLVEASRATPLGEEALEKTLFERYDVEHAREVLERIRDGTLTVVGAPSTPWTEALLGRLSWKEVADTPPPTLLKAVGDRLRSEPITLVCLRCGFIRETSAARFEAEGGSACRICKGALSAALSPRREGEIAEIHRYAARKWKRRRTPAPRRATARSIPESLPALVRQGYTSAELIAHYGSRALLALAGRGVGPDTARRLLARPYRREEDLVAEVLKAERSYAKTRAFWD